MKAGAGWLMVPAAAAALLVGALRGAKDEGYPWKAGVAKADITPDGPVWMAGYAARKAPSEGVMQKLYAKALALEDASGGRFVVVTLDLIGVPRELRAAIEEMASERHGLAPEALLLNASHTHSGPNLKTWRPPVSPGTGRGAASR